MSGGIYAGGRYVPNCGKVTLYSYSMEARQWYWPSDYSTTLHLQPSKPDTGTMYHCSPVILAFWSKEDESA